MCETLGVTVYALKKELAAMSAEHIVEFVAFSRNGQFVNGVVLKVFGMKFMKIIKKFMTRQKRLESRYEQLNLSIEEKNY